MEIHLNLDEDEPPPSPINLAKLVKALDENLLDKLRKKTQIEQVKDSKIKKEEPKDYNKGKGYSDIEKPKGYIDMDFVEMLSV